MLEYDEPPEGTAREADDEMLARLYPLAGLFAEFVFHFFKAMECQTIQVLQLCDMKSCSFRYGS